MCMQTTAVRTSIACTFLFLRSRLFICIVTAHLCRCARSCCPEAGWGAQASHLDPGPYYFFGIHTAGAQERCRNPRQPHPCPHLLSCLPVAPLCDRCWHTYCATCVRARSDQLTLSAVSAQVMWAPQTGRGRSGTLLALPEMLADGSWLQVTDVHGACAKSDFRRGPTRVHCVDGD